MLFMWALITAVLPTEAHGAERLASRLEEVSTAFREGDATHLGTSLTAITKLEADLRALGGSQGVYAAGQLEVIFRGIFRDFETRELVFGPADLANPKAAVARGRLTFRSRVAGPGEQTRNLTLLLRPESGDWRIFEIRSSR